MSPKPSAQYEKPYCAWTLNPRPYSQAVVAVIPGRVFVPCIRIILLWVFVRYIRTILLWVFVPCLACPIVVAEDCQIWTWKSALVRIPAETADLRNVWPDLKNVWPDLGNVWPDLRNVWPDLGNVWPDQHEKCLEDWSNMFDQTDQTMVSLGGGPLQAHHPSYSTQVP